MDERKKDELYKEYTQNVSEIEKCCIALKEQIEELLKINKIRLGVPIEARVKTWDSLIKNLETSKSELNSIKEIDDLIGIRIILVFRRDIEGVDQLLNRELNIIEKEDTQHRLTESQFGYQSNHYTITLREEWLKVPTLCRLMDYTIDFQVRTLAQHSWATASHILNYKSDIGVPSHMLRSIYRVSALLETVDLEFERLLEEKNEYRSQMAALPSQESLDVDILEKVMDELLPSNNKTDNENYAALLALLHIYKIETVGDFKHLIAEHIDHALEEDANYVLRLNAEPADSEVWTRWHDREELMPRLDMGVYFAHFALVNIILQRAYPDKILTSAEWDEIYRTRR